jgi:Asp/Glu/hydantoin racemase
MNGNSKHPRVFIVHTSFVSVHDLTALFRKLGPHITVHHIVDDSLLDEVLANGGVTAGVKQRMRQYFRAAAAAGADLIFSQCSSVGEAADFATRVVRVPVVKIDSAMAEHACRIGGKIGVVATLETTLGPTCRLVAATARQHHASVKIVRCLVKGAFDVLQRGDRARHNRMVLQAIRRLAKQVDVIICAQGSMIAILPELGPTPIPVLTSPELGVRKAVDALGHLNVEPRNARHSSTRTFQRSSAFPARPRFLSSKSG